MKKLIHQSKRSEAMIRPVIPTFILERYEAGEKSGSFHTGAMFIDISGFTRITHFLMQSGRGAERLLEVMNRVFSPAIKEIYEAGGFITNFAGDAFTAVFPAVPGAVLSMVADRISQHIQKDPGVPESGGSLGVKIGLSHDRTDWGILAWRPEPEAGWQHQYFFHGPVIDGAAVAQQRASSGQIVADRAFIRFEGVRQHRWKAITHRHCILDSPVQPDFPPEGFSNRWKLTGLRDRLQKDFIPPVIHDMPYDGEFREVISMFVSFRDDRDLNRKVITVKKVVHSYGGYLQTMDFGDKGAYVLIFFGAPVAVENPWSRACSCALRIVQALGDVCRIGAANGLVFAGFIGSSIRCEYTGLGLTTNLAARLMAAANWGEILADRYLVQGAGEDFLFRLAGEHDFKGFQMKIPVFRLLERNLQPDRQAFLGSWIPRKSLMEKLRDAISRATGGCVSGLIRLHGEAGTGKSRLVHALQRESAVPGMQWSHMPCDPIRREALLPVKRSMARFFHYNSQHTTKDNEEAFREHFLRLSGLCRDDDTRGELHRLRSVFRALSGFVDETGLYAQLDPKGRRENILSALQTFIRILSGVKPVCLVVDNAHYMDRDTGELLKSLLSCEQGLRVVSVGRSSPDGSPYPLPFKDVAPQDIEVGPLSIEDSRQLLQTHLEEFYPETGIRQLDQAAVNLLYKATHGNPLFLGQLLRLMIEREQLVPPGVIRIDELEFPADIRNLIIARLDRLHHSLRSIILIAAVLGVEFSEALMERVAGEYSPAEQSAGSGSDMKIPALLHEGVRYGFWDATGAGWFRFTSGLIRDTAYGIQSSRQLRTLHLACGKAMEQMFWGSEKKIAGTLADHFEAADDKKSCIQYLRLAAENARDEFANDAAIGFYERLLLHLSEPEQPDVMREIAGLHWRCGRWEEAMGLTEKALSLPGEEISETRFRLMLQRGQQLEETGRLEEAAELADRLPLMADTLKRDDLMAQSYNILGLIARRRNEFTRALALFDKQRELARAIDDPMSELRAAANTGIVQYESLGDYDRAMESFRRQYELAVALKNRQSEARAWGNMGTVYFAKDELREALRCFRTQFAIAGELGNKRETAIATGNIGTINILLEDWEQAQRYLDRQLRLAREMGDRTGEAVALSNIGEMEERQGRLEQAAVALQEALELYRKIEDLEGMEICLTILASIAARKGEWERAGKVYRQWEHLAERRQDPAGQSIAHLGATLAGLRLREDAKQMTELPQAVIQSLREMKLDEESRKDVREMIARFGYGIPDVSF